MKKKAVIVAIADDLTGAAELAGIGNAYGLHTLLLTSLRHYQPCDLVVLDTNTRSAKEEQAAVIMKEVVRDIRQRLPGDVIIFKKVDSILRGHPLSEARELKAAFGYRLVLFASANPAKGRSIVNGAYFIQKEHLHRTLFSRDPEYPRTTSDVGELLGQERLNGTYFHFSEKTRLADVHGYVTVDIARPEDLQFYVRQHKRDVLLAGAAELFEIFLSHLGARRRETKTPEPVSGKNIFVGGSIFNSMDDCELTRGIGNVFYFQNVGAAIPDLRTTASWSAEIIRYLNAAQHVRMAISSAFVADRDPYDFIDVLAETVASIVQHMGDENVNLMISGGSTASAILRRLAMPSFSVIGELDPGVVALRPLSSNTFQTIVKPGSYPWPLSLKDYLQLYD